MSSLTDLITQLDTHLKHNQPLIDFGSTLQQLSHWNFSCFQPYVKFSDINYHRQIVYQSDQFEVIIISWKQGQYTPIHDHPHQGCLMTVIRGQLIEESYQTTSNPSETIHSETTQLNPTEITYKEGNITLHRILAPIDAVSIHIYCPSRHQVTLY